MGQSGDIFQGEGERRHETRQAGRVKRVNHTSANGAECSEALRQEGTLQLAQVGLDVALVKGAVGLVERHKKVHRDKKCAICRLRAYAFYANGCWCYLMCSAIALIPLVPPVWKSAVLSIYYIYDYLCQC